MTVLYVKNYREIDRLIAEKVMGWEVPYEYDDIGIMAYTAERGGFAFSPTTNIADAWQVLEKFKREGYLFTIKNTVGGNYCFSLTDWNDMCDTFTGEAKTATLAICLAALKAVGVKCCIAS